MTYIYFCVHGGQMPLFWCLKTTLWLSEVEMGFMGFIFFLKLCILIASSLRKQWLKNKNINTGG